ncbi:MAG TPA: hypothetical protein VMT16_03040, partial [Thermoanaerobaculia bacterium]|nr:hypothetical protein [Thermoanaerobaculia bacterium]
RPPGPSAERLAHGVTRQWGEVVDAAGARAVSRQQGPQAYRWTALTAVAVAERVLAGDAPPGFRTPAGAYGADFVLQIEGVQREDVPTDRTPGGSLDVEP